MQQIEVTNCGVELNALLAGLANGEELVLTAAERPVAKLIKLEQAGLPAAAPRQATLEEILEQLVALDPFREIDDPVAWVRELRQDRPLPYR